MHLYPSPFSPAQMTWLQSFVDHRLDQRLDAPPPDDAAYDRYYSIPELRAVIVEHEDDLRRRFGVDRPFPISALRHEIRQWLDLSEADLAVTPNGTVARWESQLNSAIEPRLWEGSPFARQPRRGYWVIKPKALPAQTMLRLPA